MSDPIDTEIYELCTALNLLPGIETISSCCGHSRVPIAIFFKAESLEALPKLLYWFMSCHSGQINCVVRATTDCSAGPVAFVVEGPAGDYDAGRKIAECIKGDIG